MNSIFFSSWESLARTFVVGTMAYVALVVILRITGKRTLSKLNAFDLVVTVALGSTLATVLLSKDVALADGMLAFLLLCGLQFLVTWSSVRVRWVSDFVKAEPRIVVRSGELLASEMKRERITKAEIQAALRSAHLHDITEADVVTLETDGSLSVIPRSNKFSSEKISETEVPRTSSGYRTRL